MAQPGANTAVPKPAPAAPLSPATIAALREQVLSLLVTDPEIQAKLRALVPAPSEGPVREIGAAEAGQIMDLIEKQVGGLLDKRIERVVRSLVRPDYLLRPHLRPDAIDSRP